MKIHPKVKVLAASLGLDIRVSNSPKESRINNVEFKNNLPIAFYLTGTGIIWVNKRTKSLSSNDIQIVILHEIGHAVIDYYQLEISQKFNEVKANAIALAYAAILDLPISEELLNEFSDYTKSRKLYFNDFKYKKTRK